MTIFILNSNFIIDIIFKAFFYAVTLFIPELILLWVFSLLSQRESFYFIMENQGAHDFWH